MSSINFTVIVPRWVLWIRLYVATLLGASWVMWTAFQIASPYFHGLVGIAEIYGIVIAAHLIGVGLVGLDWRLDSRRESREWNARHAQRQQEFERREEERRLDREAGRARVAATWARYEAIRDENCRRFSV